jgi:hypothetical protein
MKIATKLSGIALATAAAAMFMAAPVAFADDAGSAVGKCIGGNACKGQGSCKTAHNACKGQNSCKGTGFTEVNKDDCAKAGGKFEGPSK